VFNRGKIVMARFRTQIGGRKRHRLSISALLCPGAAKSDQQTMRDERHKGCRHYARLKTKIHVAQLAEGVGFEPTRERKPSAGFQDRCLKPLGHPSKPRNIEHLARFKKERM
jgi:hypothetical protein